jgi:NAD(P)H-dependent FMN reductase
MITIISCTHRANSASLKVSQFIQKELQAQGCNAEIWDLQHLPADFLFAEMFNERSPAMAAQINLLIENARQIIWVVPEYNGSFSGITKVLLDAVSPKIWQNKWCYLVGVSSGAAGNLRGQEHLTGIMHYLKMHVHYHKPKLSAIESSWDESGEHLMGRNADQLKTLAQLVNEDQLQFPV